MGGKWCEGSHHHADVQVTVSTHARRQADRYSHKMKKAHKKAKTVIKQKQKNKK